MKKRIHRRKVVHRAKKNDQLWGIIWFVVLLFLALATLLASRQSYLLGQTLGTTCTDTYNVCPTNTSTPIPSKVTTTVASSPSVGTTISPSVTTTISPSVSPSLITTPILSPSITTTGIITAPSDDPALISNPESTVTPAIPSPRSFQSLISDPDTGLITSQSLIAAPAALSGALYDVAYDSILSQINAFTNSATHIDSPAINRFRLPAQVCTLLGNVGMEWLCE